jgi:hypothetical protein
MEYKNNKMLINNWEAIFSSKRRQINNLLIREKPAKLHKEFPTKIKEKTC